MTYWFKGGIFLIAGFVFVADRLTKYFIIKCLVLGQSIKVIPGIFHITLVFNNGAAFGLLQDRALFFVIFSFAAIALILLIISKARQLDTLFAVSLALILGGAAGNLIDRLKFGYVIDFLDFRVWPVFNIADSCISIGIALIAFSIILNPPSGEASHKIG